MTRAYTLIINLVVYESRDLIQQPQFFIQGTLDLPQRSITTQFPSKPPPLVFLITHLLNLLSTPYVQQEPNNFTVPYPKLELHSYVTKYYHRPAESLQLYPNDEWTNSQPRLIEHFFRHKAQILFSNSHFKQMYWGPEQEDNQAKPTFQVTRKQVKQRGRKRLSPLDIDTQRYECFCLKQYQSYCALYSHVKAKHADFFEQNKSFGATNMVDTFDPNFGYKIRKLLVEKIQFNSESQRNGSVTSPSVVNGGTTSAINQILPDFSLKAAVTRNYKHFLDKEDKMAMIAQYDNKNNSETTQSLLNRRPRRDLTNTPDLDLEAIEEKIHNASSEELKALAENILQKLKNTEFMIDKFEEGKCFELYQISRLMKKLEQYRQLVKNQGRQVQITQQKSIKLSQIIQRQQQIANGYDSILRIINIKPIVDGLNSGNRHPAIDEDDSDSEYIEGQ